MSFVPSTSVYSKHVSCTLYTTSFVDDRAGLTTRFINPFTQTIHSRITWRDGKKDEYHNGRDCRALENANGQKQSRNKGQVNDRLACIKS